MARKTSHNSKPEIALVCNLIPHSIISSQASELHQKRGRTVFLSHSSPSLADSFLMSEVEKPGVVCWNPQLGLNYSNAGCDLVSRYIYAGSVSAPSNGSNLDWSMSVVLPTME